MSSGGMSSALDKLDPVGNKITQWGGDPLNLYGNQNNPNAALFPSGAPASAVPGVLPNLGATSLMPRTPQGAFVAPSSASGPFNSMAQQLAGPLFNPAIAARTPTAGQAASQMTPAALPPGMLAAYIRSAGPGVIPRGTQVR